MKKSIIVLMLFACVSLNMHAQVIMKPSEPNEVCAQAWEKYHKGDVLWKTGWGLFGAGGAIAIAGGITFGVTGYARVDPEGRHVFNPTPLIGYSVFAVGAGMFVASIPCVIVGQVQRKSASKEYNENCTDQTPLTFSIQSSANGLGLAMQF